MLQPPHHHPSCYVTLEPLNASFIQGRLYELEPLHSSMLPSLIPPTHRDFPLPPRSLGLYTVSHINRDFPSKVKLCTATPTGHSVHKSHFHCLHHLIQNQRLQTWAPGALNYQPILKYTCVPGMDVFLCGLWWTFPHGITSRWSC